MSLPLLPLPHDIETKAVLKKAARAHQALAELKGVVASIPNQTILVNTLSLEFLMQELDVTRKTASKYLEQLVGISVLSKHKLGKVNYYLNTALFDLLHGAGSRLSRAST